MFIGTANCCYWDGLNVGVPPTRDGGPHEARSNQSWSLCWERGNSLLEFCRYFSSRRKRRKKRRNMEVLQSWRVRFSFRNATIVVCFLNVVAALLLLQNFFSSASSRYRISTSQFTSEQSQYIKESEEIRLAMQPLELIKRVMEIEQEAYAKPEMVQQKDTKQTAAVDLSKRLKDFRSLNDAGSLKALEEWRKRKMERARQRELGKNGSATSQA
ncbi:uncharacterized protein LOC121236594 [Juglans microcarpa x Juglans regia]|uniref:uncharacterized protein LOC121236594 n=1 Tax=Juglans microcarpa x Juglans regia TaxID=2249226 RepID=UPI001B7EC715|nr:uncharacterized protein LOC121236594 [Juglans microcarpa x Juglans regia]